MNITARMYEILVEATGILGVIESQSSQSLPYQLKQLKIKMDLAIIAYAGELRAQALEASISPTDKKPSDSELKKPIFPDGSSLADRAKEEGNDLDYR